MSLLDLRTPNRPTTCCTKRNFILNGYFYIFVHSKNSPIFFFLDFEFELRKIRRERNGMIYIQEKVQLLNGQLGVKLVNVVLLEHIVR